MTATSLGAGAGAVLLFGFLGDLSITISFVLAGRSATDRPNLAISDDIYNEQDSILVAAGYQFEAFFLATVFGVRKSQRSRIVKQAFHFLNCVGP